MAEESTKWKRIIFIGLGILLLLIILITLFVGISGLRQFFIWLFGIIIALGILFGLAYIFYIIFIQKSYKDIPFTYRKKLIRTAKLMKNKMLGDLYLSGDYKHNRIKLGKFLYMRITMPKTTTEKKTEGHRTIETVNTEAIPIDAFFIIKKGIIETLFGQPVVIIVKPEDHDYSSIFNDVTVSGFNLVPLDSQFYTINRRDIDVDLIKGLATSYIRETVYEILRELDKLVKQAMNLDQQFQKEKQKGLEFEIPQLQQLGGQNR